MFSFFPLDPRAFTSQRANHERFFHHDQFSWPFTFSHLKILFRMKPPRREVWFEVIFFAWTNANQLLFVSWSILLHVPTLKYDPGVRGIGECDLSHCGGCTRRSTISCFRSFGCMTGMAHKRHSSNFFDPGELLVEYTVLQPEGSEEETSEHVEDLMEKAGCMSIDFEYLLDLGMFDIFVRYASKILKSRVLRSSSITVSRSWVITLYQCCFFYI